MKASETDRTDGLVVERWLGADVRCYRDRPRTIVELLDRAVRLHPGRTALETPEGDVTYAGFAEMVEGAAARLAEEGIGAGDRVAVALRNGLDIVVAIWACARLGAVFVGLSTRLAPPQWAYVLRHSGASLALGHPEYLESLQQAGDDAGMAGDRVRPVADHLTGRRLPWDRGRAFPDQDSSYAVIYTSGTTGRPKASRMVHRGTVHSAIAYVRTMALTAEDRTAITFPLYYMTGHIAQVSTMMLTGGTCVTLTDLVASRLVALVAEKRITYLMVTPSLWPMLLRVSGFSWPELGHLTVGAFGGSPVPLSTVTALRDRMPQLRLYDAYGLTETHSPSTILLDHEFRRKAGSVGRPLPCCDVKVVDEEGNALPAGQAGELCIRGPMVTSGYDGDSAATDQAITPDGWLRSGDLCRIDDEGYVYLLDRKKDVVIRGGNKVYSVELEYILVGHPDIEQAAVFGIPDVLALEAVCAMVVPTAGRAIEPPAVQAWVRSQMADYAVPRHVSVVEAIPRNATGKIDKPLLRRQLLAGLAGR